MIYNNQLKLTPWVDHSEFEVISPLLQTRTDLDLEKVISIIELWQIKFPFHQIPRSAHLTKQLCQGILDKSSQSLSLAILRLISIINDEKSSKEKSNFAIPLKKLIQTSATLPNWMCDLRNDIAHGSMPSDHFLNLCVGFCFETLLEFWTASPTFELGGNQVIGEKEVFNVMRNIYLKNQPYQDIFAAYSGLVKNTRFHFDVILLIFKSIYEFFDENLQKNPPETNAETVRVLQVIHDSIIKKTDFSNLVEFCFLKATDSDKTYLAPFLFIFKTKNQDVMKSVNMSFCSSQVNKMLNCPQYLSDLFKYKDIKPSKAKKAKIASPEKSLEKAWSLNFTHNWHSIPFGSCLGA